MRYSEIISPEILDEQKPLTPEQSRKRADKAQKIQKKIKDIADATALKIATQKRKIFDL